MDEQKPITSQLDDLVAKELEPLGEDKAVVAVTSDQDTLVRAGGAVDLGKGFAAGGHVEKKRSSGWSWFAGVRKRWLK